MTGQQLVQGIIRDESRVSYLEVIGRLRQEGAEGIIAGCTEIELLISQDDLSLPYFPTTKLHAQAVDTALTST
jgi:amino-acid racemase